MLNLLKTSGLRPHLLRAALAGLVVLGTAMPTFATDSIEGRWLTGKRKVAVELFRCGDDLCGKIDWLAKPRYRGGELKIDRENPNPALRSRPWCGIDIIWRLRQKEPGIWTGGKVYNPKDGRTYDLEIKRRGNGLRVKAYLGVKLLGKSEDWIPAPKDTPGCTDVNQTSPS